jgi:hypothetical protein
MGSDLLEGRLAAVLAADVWVYAKPEEYCRADTRVANAGKARCRPAVEQRLVWLGSDAGIFV